MARYINTPKTSLKGINAELEKIEDAFKDVLDRQGEDPNYMDTDLDMNSHRILNLPAPVHSQEPVRLGDVKPFINDTQTARDAAIEAAENAQGSAEDSASSATEAADSASKAKEVPEINRALLIAQGLSGNYGFFEKGFTYNEVGDVGIDSDGGMWTYNGALPFEVNKGVEPKSPDYSIALPPKAKKSTQDLKNMVVSLKSEGEVVYLHERGAFFEVSSSGEGNDLWSINSDYDNAVYFNLKFENEIDIRQAGIVTDGTEDVTSSLQSVINYAEYKDVGITGKGSVLISGLVTSNNVNIDFERLTVKLADNFTDDIGFNVTGSKLGYERYVKIFMDGNKDNQIKNISAFRVNGVSNPLGKYTVGGINCSNLYVITGSTEKSKHRVSAYNCGLVCELIDGTGSGDQTPDESDIQIHASSCDQYFKQTGNSSAWVHIIAEQQNSDTLNCVEVSGTKVTTLTGELRGMKSGVLVNNALQRININLMMQSTQSAFAECLLDIQSASIINGSLIGDNPNVKKLRVNQLDSGGFLTIADDGDAPVTIEVGGLSTCKRLNLNLAAIGEIELVNSADFKCVSLFPPTKITASGSSDWHIVVPEAFITNDYELINNGSQSGMLEVAANMSKQDIINYSYPDRSIVINHCRDVQGMPVKYINSGGVAWGSYSFNSL